MKKQTNQEKKKLIVLYSGGKDSSLAALMLSKFFKVELVTITFGLLQNWKNAEKAAKRIKFPFRLLKLDKKIIETAAKIVVKDGFPNEGIKYIHQRVLEEIAKEANIVADGVRRNDRVPVMSLSEVMRVEDKLKIHYLQPLMGISRKTINLLVEEYFTIKEYKGASFAGAEYEFELREFVRKKYGLRKLNKIFPQNHTHTIVLSAR